MSEWRKQMWYTHTRRYYSAIGKRKTLPSATTWMDPEGIKLSKISQTEKDKYPMISLFREIKKRKRKRIKNNKQKPESDL